MRYGCGTQGYFCFSFDGIKHIQCILWVGVTQSILIFDSVYTYNQVWIYMSWKMVLVINIC